ncbi:SPOR domain-containing protein [Acidithiobacillus sp. IBUN Pt1247-S3]|uniref:SPOR domain-containing protein n=1 Tax=Acidithiobacillus sp. IBUN Pt1247-S3 TaxID=3166642 RepID=UPI0034E57F66
MRDYKGHSSRNPQPEPTHAPPTQRRVQPVVEAEPEEELEISPSARRRGHGWIWLLLIALLLLSGAIWWWVASLPMASGQLGLYPSVATQETTSAVPAATAPKPASSNAVPVAKTALAASAPVLSTAVAASVSSATASTQSVVQFNFYHILPQMKVDIPADILGSGPGIPSAQTSSAPAAAPVRIQVGALNNLAGAQVIQERLELLGIPSRLENLRGNDGASYYLVFTRRYASPIDAQSALAKIRGMGVTPMLQPVAPNLSGPSAPPAP